MGRHIQGELWIPSAEQVAARHIPTPDQLTLAWRVIYDDAEHFTVPDVYGTCRIPSEQPSAIAAIDLCEVIRQTGVAMTEIAGQSDIDLSGDYGRAAIKYEDLLDAACVPELMINDLVKPVPYIDAIAIVLQTWRKRGVYIVANTSTLPACEIPTIRFINRHLPQCFDGMLLPRNHDGTGKVTKGHALAGMLAALESQGFSTAELPLVFIEDMPHHARDVKTLLPEAQIFMPSYPWNENVPDTVARRVERGFSTFDTFWAANLQLQESISYDERVVA